MVFQVDTKDLNGDFLCNPPDHNQNGSTRVLLDWKRTSSPLWSYWGKVFQNQDLLNDYILPKDRCLSDKAYTLFKFGLPGSHSKEADDLCKARYAQEIVKLVVEIAEPTVMMIEKDVSATFTDHLGTIGEINCSL